MPTGPAGDTFTPMAEEIFEFADVIAAYRYLDSPDQRSANRCCGCAADLREAAARLLAGATSG